MNMSKFHDHHADVRALIATVERRIQAAGGDGLASVAPDLVRLFGKLTIHLAIEDTVLYPRLAKVSNAELQRMAVRVQKEMGGLKARFDLYSRSWPGPQAIGKDPAGFLRETRDVLAQMKARLDREDRQLYPLAEQALAS